MPVGQIVLEALFMSLACSMDSLVTGFAYGTNKIKISLLSAITVSFICSAMLCLSLFLGSAIGKYIPAAVTLTICVVILCALGLSKIFNSFIKSLIKRKNGINKDIKFSAFSLKFLINISANPVDADIDNSKNLSIVEAIPLAIALSLDGIAVGLGAGLTSHSAWNYLIVVSFSFIGSIVFLLSGLFTGQKLAKKTSLNLSWLSGLLLIGLAVMKIFL